MARDPKIVKLRKIMKEKMGPEEIGRMGGKMEDHFKPWLCGACIFLKDARTCRAFPEGIPEEIWEGRVSHDKPYPGDNGIRFVRISPRNMSE